MTSDRQVYECCKSLVEIVDNVAPNQLDKALYRDGDILYSLRVLVCQAARAEHDALYDTHHRPGRFIASASPCLLRFCGPPFRDEASWKGLDQRRHHYRLTLHVLVALFTQ